MTQTMVKPDRQADLFEAQSVLGCLERGVYFHAYAGRAAPGHAGFSLAHGDDDLATALQVIDEVAADLASGRERGE